MSGPYMYVFRLLKVNTRLLYVMPEFSNTCSIIEHLIKKMLMKKNKYLPPQDSA